MNLAKIVNKADVQELMHTIQNMWRRHGAFEVVGLEQQMEKVQQELELIREVTQNKVEKELKFQQARGINGTSQS